MKTIRFYSYKGGVGRTLLTAHIARLLAACGKKVVVMDFDFDAPGIPTIFGFNPFKLDRGFVNLYKEKKNAALYEHDMFMKRSDLEKLCTNDSFIRNFSKKILKNLVSVPIDDRSSTGYLKFFPCGCPQKIEYWENVSSIAEECMNLKDNDKHVVFYYLNIVVKKVLESLGVEYFLIDSRAGITCFGDITRSIADKEALIFCPNDDTRHVWPQLWDNKKNKPKYWCSPPPSDWITKLEYVCIVSRMPPELDAETQLKFEEMKTILTSKNQDKNFLGVLPLHSDLKTHLDPRCRFKNTANSEIVQFHKDICEILVTLCPEVLSKEDKKLLSVTEKACAFWLATFKRPLEITHINRLFDLYIKRGEMRNSDKSRNVAFKVETFLRFLNQFYDMQQDALKFQPEFQNEPKRNAECQKRINKALETAGKQCGEAFGKTLFSLKSKDIPDAKILKWCKFDTQAGFGKMTYKNEILTIKKLFIRDSRITGKHRDYTAFFTGYAIGVLQVIISPSATLERCVNDEKSGETKYKITFKSESK